MGQRRVYIKSRRTGYDPDQVSGTMTVGELIDELSCYDSDTEVMIVNDNGYTFGEVSCDTILYTNRY